MLIGERYPGLLIEGTISDSAYDNFMQFQNESSGLGLRTCNLEAIMNEVSRFSPSVDSRAAGQRINGNQWSVIGRFQSVEGTGLVFIVFTQAIVELPAAPFWAIIFFLMLLALGLGSQIGTLEGVISTVFDTQLCRNVRKEVVSGNYLSNECYKDDLPSISIPAFSLLTFKLKNTKTYHTW